jgi:hypothetical protein
MKTNPVNNASTKVAGGYTFSTKPRKASRNPTAKNAATPASPAPAHELNMCLGQSAQWAAKPSAALGWHGQYSASALRQPYITCVVSVRSKKAELCPFDGKIPKKAAKMRKNNLIVASSYSFSKTTRSGILDSDFYIFRTKFELAGNALSLLAKATGQGRNANKNYTFMDIEFSQYIKNEVEFIKHWDLSQNKVIAMRLFSGIAIPYGNSNNIPFSRSYFAGGSNDNRAWRPFSLGPGSTSAQNDFNEANLKLAFSTEFRFKLFGSFRGALFTDIGNIWNVLDNTSDPNATFNGFQSLQDIAIGSGFGLRYDFSFFVVRLDMGFKTYNPANEMERRWFNEYNFKNSVLNIGINYPF